MRTRGVTLASVPSSKVNLMGEQVSFVQLRAWRFEFALVTGDTVRRRFTTALTKTMTQWAAVGEDRV